MPQFVTILSVATLLFIAGCGKTPVAETDPNKPVAVKAVAVVQEELARTSTQPATVVPYHEAEIRAKLTGYLSELRVDIGDIVEEGAVLAVLDLPEMLKQKEVLASKVKRAEAEVQRATSAVQLAESEQISAAAKRDEAAAEIDKGNANLAASEAEFQRVRDLVNRKSLQGRLLDEATKRRDADRAQVTAFKSALKSAEAGVTVARSKLTAAEADLSVAEAETEIARHQLAELEEQLKYAVLKAPFAGVVTARTVDLGDLVRAGTDSGKPKGEALFVVSQISQVRVHVPVPERDAAFVNRGDEIVLTFPSFPRESMIVKVTRTSLSLDPSTRTMLVEAVVENTDGKLIPGMFGTAQISLSGAAVANKLPARAVRFDETGNAFVYALRDDDTVAIVPVETGADDGEHIEIRSGLDAGRRVVDAHLKRFTDGQPVRVLNN